MIKVLFLVLGIIFFIMIFISVINIWAIQMNEEETEEAKVKSIIKDKIVHNAK